MKITLLGASGGEVTGSAYLIQTNDANVMVDCGLFQGAQKLENFNRLPSKSALQARELRGPGTTGLGTCERRRHDRSAEEQRGTHHRRTPR